MRLALELSGEHPELPRTEAEAVLSTFGVTPVTDVRPPRIAFGDVPTAGAVEPQELAARMAARLAMTHTITELIEAVPLPVGPGDDDLVDAVVEALVALAPKVPVDGARFAVRCSRLDPAMDRTLAPRVHRGLGEALAARGTVDLGEPQVVVRVLVSDRIVLGLERAVVDRSAFEARHVEQRPYFSPISLHPRLARAIVNLARVPAGARVWDPFSGTGGLVLEAALVGLDVVASDLDPRMVEGTRATLAHFGHACQPYEGDVADVAARLRDERRHGPGHEAGRAATSVVDAIVTDPPYGRASSTHREDVRALYRRFFEAGASVLAPGGRLVCVLPDPSDAALAGNAFELETVVAWKVHGSLTRHVHVFARDGPIGEEAVGEGARGEEAGRQGPDGPEDHAYRAQPGSDRVQRAGTRGGLPERPTGVGPRGRAHFVE